MKIVDRPQDHAAIENYHERRYNAPVVGSCEFGAIVQGGDEGAEPDDIVGDGNEFFSILCSTLMISICVDK